MTIDLDTTAPTVSTPILDPATVWPDGEVAVTADVTDALAEVPAAEVFVGADPGVGAASPLTVGAGTATGALTAPSSPGDYPVGVRAQMPRETGARS